MFDERIAHRLRLAEVKTPVVEEVLQIPVRVVVTEFAVLMRYRQPAQKTNQSFLDDHPEYKSEDDWYHFVG